MNRHVKRCSEAFCILLFIVILSSCGSDTSTPLSYTAAIQEGRTAAQAELKRTGSPSLSAALLVDNTVVWAEGFGLADKDTNRPPTTETLYGIGSVSKMFATVAVMKLVDQGKIILDAPVTDYLPQFSMLSPEYRQVTVRMLINHSPGFPGSDYRNSMTTSPYTGYADQVLATLQQSHLKHLPGLLNVYCNDGFTLVEKVVQAVSGKAYTQFVRDEIFTPLGMTNTYFPLAFFPAGSFARAYDDKGQVVPQEFGNFYASGGIYSTPSDVMRLARMLIGKGVMDGVRILSAASVATMGTDQTIGTFSPVASETVRFGLGWDSVSDPGLAAVGIRGWTKSGGTVEYGTHLVVLPDEGMAALVTSVKEVNTLGVAQRVLLRALVEKGRIPAVPAPYTATPLPVKTPTPAELAAITGYYAADSALKRVTADASGTLSIEQFADGAWGPSTAGLRMRPNGWFSSDDTPATEFRHLNAGAGYLVTKQATGAEHYRDQFLTAQRLSPVGTGALSPAWQARLARKWLLVNFRSDMLAFSGYGTLLTLYTLTGADQPRGLLIAGWNNMVWMLDPSLSDERAMIANTFRDQSELVVETRAGEEWLLLGSMLFRPQETVPSVTLGGSLDVAVGAEGLAEWVQINPAGQAAMLTLTTGGTWRIYDASLKWQQEGTGNAVILISGTSYLMLQGDAGSTTTVAVGP